MCVCYSQLNNRNRVSHDLLELLLHMANLYGHMNMLYISNITCNNDFVFKMCACSALDRKHMFQLSSNLAHNFY